MEYALWLFELLDNGEPGCRLNPCSNGICSLTQSVDDCYKGKHGCLNPCSNGICSLTLRIWRKVNGFCVLILVLMEYALWRIAFGFEPEPKEVLILVLMEYALWQSINSNGQRGREGVLILVLMEYALWPCVFRRFLWSARVLILVLMEYALWPYTIIAIEGGKSLNPCSNGICSLTIQLYHHCLFIDDVLILVLMEYALWH